VLLFTEKYVTHLTPIVYSEWTISNLGCWEDTWDRAIPTLEEKDPILDGNNYDERVNPIEKCAYAALNQGYIVFGVQVSHKNAACKS